MSAWQSFKYYGASLLTKVADMPGYPTKKLLFGLPDTRTEAAICSVSQPTLGAAARGGDQSRLVGDSFVASA